MRDRSAGERGRRMRHKKFKVKRKKWKGKKREEEQRKEAVGEGHQQSGHKHRRRFEMTAGEKKCFLARKRQKHPPRNKESP